MHLSIPREAAAYFESVNAGNATAALNSFHSKARILDVDRVIAGASDIQEWLVNEVMGGTYRLVKTTPQPSGVRVLLEFTTPDNETFRADYLLTFLDGKIETANLQYA